MTSWAIEDLVSFKQHVVSLRRKGHKATLANTIHYIDNSKAIAMLTKGIVFTQKRLFDLASLIDALVIFFLLALLD